MRDNELLLKLENDIVESSKRKQESLKARKEAFAHIRLARKGTNEASIAAAEKALEEVSTKPALCKEDIAKYRANLKEVRTTEGHNQQAVEYAKQELKDAKIRLKTARKEVRMAKSGLRYVKRVGDSDKIVAEYFLFKPLTYDNQYQYVFEYIVANQAHIQFSF